MTLVAAPHPPSVFRYLKQAWREYIASGNAQTITVNTPANQPAANPLTVTGVVLVDASVPKPVQLIGNFVQLPGGALMASVTTYSDRYTGAFAFTVPGSTLAAGQAAVNVYGIDSFGSGTNAFTLT